MNNGQPLFEEKRSRGVNHFDLLMYLNILPVTVLLPSTIIYKIDAVIFYCTIIFYFNEITLTLDLKLPWWSSSFLQQILLHHGLCLPSEEFLLGFPDLTRFCETYRAVLVPRYKWDMLLPLTARLYLTFLLSNHREVHYGSYKQKWV